MHFPSARAAVLLIALVLAGCRAADPPDRLIGPTATSRGFSLFVQHYFLPELSEIDPVTLSDMPGRQGIGLPGREARHEVSIIASAMSPVLAIEGQARRVCSTWTPGRPWAASLRRTRSAFVMSPPTAHG